MSIQKFFKSVISSSSARGASGRSRCRSRRPRWSLHSAVLEALEDRTLLSTITWVTKSGSDSGFGAVFGPNADRAKIVVRAALNAWQNVIQNFNYHDASLKNNLNVFVEMGDKTGFGASASILSESGGKPREVRITINTGRDGHGAGWFLDPTPNQSEEFRGDLVVGEGMGSIVNPYVAAPTPGGPASKEMGIGGDLYSVVVLEMTHAVGLVSNPDLQLAQDAHNYILHTGGKDSLDTPGELLVFRGPSVDALLTTNNGGPGGTNTRDPAHVANPGLENMVSINGGYFHGSYYGARDSGNASDGATFRRQPSYLDALILKDAYGYTINPPTSNSMYVNYDPSTGNLLVRGGSSIEPVYSNAVSYDEITLRRVDIKNVPYVIVDVKIGSPIKGTGPNPLYGNLIPLSMISSITVKGGDGNDTIRIGDGSIYGLPPVTVDGGSGKDSIIVDDRSDFAAYTYTVTNSTVERNIGFDGLTYANAENLTLITEPKTTAPLTTVNVESTAAATPVTITGSGNSIIKVGKAGSVGSIRGDLMVNPTGKAALRVDASNDLGKTFLITYTGISGLAPALISYGTDRLSSLTVSAGSGFSGNTITVRSTPQAPVILNTGFNDDFVQIRSTLGPLTVNGQSGADTVSIGKNGSVRSITGQLTVTNADNFSAVVVDDSGDRGARTAIVYKNRPSEGSFTVISGLIQGGDILLRGADLSSLAIQTGSGGNTFRIHDTPTSSIPGGLTTTIITGDGNDLVTVDGTTGSLSLGVGMGNNQINFGSGNASLDAIQGAIRLVGLGGTNAVRIDDRLSTTNQILTHTISKPSFGRSAPTYTRTGAAPFRLFDVTNFTLLAGNAADTINVQGRPVPNKNLNFVDILAGSGNDIINIGTATNQLAGIGAVSIKGQAGADEVNIYDQGTTSSRNYDLGLVLGTVPSITTSDALLLYYDFENMSLFCGSGGSTITVSGINLSPYLGGNLATIHTGTGDDVVTVGTTLDGIKSPLSIDGQGGDDRMILNDSTAKTGQTYDVLPGSFSRTNSARISFGALEYLDVTGTSFDDSFRIGDATHALDGLEPVVTLYGGAAIDQLLFDDSAAPTSHDYTLNGAQFDRDGLPSVHFRKFEGITVNADTHGNNVFVTGTAAAAPVTLNGGSGGQDVFWIGFGVGVDSLKDILGPVTIHGQQADIDVANYFDYSNPDPGTYNLTANTVQRVGLPSLMTFDGLGEVTVTTAHVGGNAINVRSVASGSGALIGAANGDTAIVGSLAPNPGGTLAGILSDVVVIVNDLSSKVTLVVDDSGNQNIAPRLVTITPPPVGPNNGSSVTGLAQGRIFWKLGTDSPVSILGGDGNETFAMEGPLPNVALAINGGGGVNTLDFSAYPAGGDALSIPGIVSWYKGEGNANDAVGGNNGVLVNGAAFAPGKVGQAFSFDGIDDFVEIPDSPDQTPSAISIAAWVNPNTIAGFQVIISKYQSNEPENYSWEFSNVNGRLEFGVYQGTTGRIIQTIEPVLTAGVWHHVAGTFDLATQSLKIFLDGVEVPSTFLSGHDVPITAINDSSSPVRIGALVNSSGVVDFSWNGRIDEPALYSRALSVAEIQSIFDAGSAGRTTGESIGVTANLLLSTATGIGGGIANIQNVIGSAGNDILVGNGGNVLSGGLGRDFLIAGTQASTLFGGGNEDILIAGWTDYDTNQVALNAIMAEWSRTDIDYDARIANLQSGTNGVPALNADTVHSNGGGNQLTGGADRDWFLSSLESDLLDWDWLTEEWSPIL